MEVTFAGVRNRTIGGARAVLTRLFRAPDRLALGLDHLALASDHPESNGAGNHFCRGRPSDSSFRIRRIGRIRSDFRWRS
jgi:hypothetical protein